MDTPQIDDFLLFAGQLAAAMIAVAGIITIMYKILFQNINNKLEKIEIELRPNGGSSLRDAINRIEKSQDQLSETNQQIREKIDDHIVWHLDN